MEDSVEYLFARPVYTSPESAAKQGWQPLGRTGWIKPNGKEVRFIFFAEQIEALDNRVTTYVVGELPPKLKHLDRKWKKI